jgi:hypothetical protein
MRFAREAVGASASSLFLVDVLQGSLRGLVSEWDWTRTSFPTNLGDWPSVEVALEDGSLRFISASRARGAEAGWFEARGIASTSCVPMRSRLGPLGVLFFDFEDRTAPLERPEEALLGDVGRRCARAISRASEAGLAEPPLDPSWIH